MSSREFTLFVMATDRQPSTDALRIEAGLIQGADLLSLRFPSGQVGFYLGVRLQVIPDNIVDIKQWHRRILLGDFFGCCARIEGGHHAIQRDALLLTRMTPFVSVSSGSRSVIGVGKAVVAMTTGSL